LPQPDSPTSPSVSPLWTWKETPATARSTPTGSRRTQPPNDLLSVNDRLRS
jgi:hypothetical protein